MAKRLRSGYTTGACSAAAAKAATFALVNGTCPSSIEIPFPDGSRHPFKVHRCSLGKEPVSASVIKDAGDDPDVTNGAEIICSVSYLEREQSSKDCVQIGELLLCRGDGVGTVTKPGLAVQPGEPAINPVPRKMISDAVREISSKPFRLTVAIAGGEQLAEKTLNHRLGIVGGLSILGTTGIVRPVSADAWTATISASMDVAREAGLKEIVISTGRTSERGAQNELDLPIEAYAMMGDYLEFSLKEAGGKGFTTIHLSAMWAKLMKAAMRVPQTHVRHGSLEIQDGAQFLKSLGADNHLMTKLNRSNSAREMLTHIEEWGRKDLIQAVCLKAREYAEEVSGVKVMVYLINHKGETIAHV